jgi:hypothetical protein
MPTTSFSFLPVSSPVAVSGLYQASTGDPRIAFILPAGTPPTPSAALSAADAWGKAQGIYLFLGAKPSDPAAFADAVRHLLATPTAAATRLLWIQNPDDPFTAWSYVAVGASAPTAAGATLPASAIFGFRNYALVIEGGSLLTSDASGLRIHPPQHAGAVSITVDDGERALPIATTSAGAVGDIVIPLSGPQAGCLCFPITLPSGPPGAAPIDWLDVGCRFYFQDTGWPGMGLFDSLRYPLFDTATSSIVFNASMDPLAPLDPVRTRWAFDGSHALPSFYRTNLGHVVTLTPAANSGLVFAPRPRGTAAARRDPFTLVPDGPFALAVPEAAAGVPTQLQCGISGAEFVDLAAGPAVLTFVAGQPAYAPSFLPAVSDDAAPAGGTGLTASPGSAGSLTPSTLTTAWAAISSAKVKLPYHAQPDNAALYGGSNPQGLLPYFQVMAEALPQTPADSRASSYPLVPYAGLVAIEVPHAGQPTGDFTPYTHLEVQVLSPTRRGAVYALRSPPAPSAPAAVKAVTPQGLIATFSADHAFWSSLELAQAGAEQLAFQNIIDPLKSALLSNQQFIVISDPAAFQAYFSANNTLPIDGWRFKMDPTLWSQHGTILIIKNSDKSLSDLVNDTGTWALGGTFNTSASATQAALQQIFADAFNKLHDPNASIVDYEHFVDVIVSDPGWNGVLFLNCPVPLSGLPDVISALAAGIDASKFYAHHFGINQTPITHADLTMDDSSLFGLIRYDGVQGDGVPPGEQYGFLVNSLYVLFANSLVKTFSSKVTVTLNQLFGSAATQQDPPGGVASNSILLTGVLQRHGSAESYVFGEDSPTDFALDDAVLGAVRISQAHFATGSTRAPDGTPLTGPQHYRFSFRGAMIFNALAGADLFSYDLLAFDNLGVVMTFDIASGKPPSFAFDAADMVFDVPHSTTRSTGLVGHFPLKLQGLFFSSSQKPADMGYRPVHPPAESGALSAAWYGLSFELPLGTLGALGPSGAFTAGFALVWSPAPAGASAAPVYVGLKLPGLMGGDHGIPLMGLLKLKTFSNQLIYQNGAFVLKINGISLGFLGASLPMGGTFDFMIFGDPGSAGSSSLGWYGSYRTSP